MSRDRKTPKWYSSLIPEAVRDSTLFKFTVRIPRINDEPLTVEVDLTADLDIDYDMIRQQLEDTPSEFAYWAAIHSELKMQVAKLQRRLKARRGKVAYDLIKEAIARDIKLTQKQVDTAVEADSKLNELEAQLMIMEKHCGKMYYMVEAIRMKAENLRSLSGFAKIEMGH